MKKRIIPIILIDKGGRVITSKCFKSWRTVGVLAQMLKMHDSREADELIVLDIFATKENRRIENRIFSLISENCRIPVTVGGGIDSVNAAQHYINQGADKICINHLSEKDQKTVKLISDSLGRQAVVISINYLKIKNNFFSINYLKNEKKTELLEIAIQRAITQGAGEILLTSVAKDGSLTGMDKSIIPFLNKIKAKVPIILAGGAKSPEDYIKFLGLKCIKAIGASSIFCFTEHTPKTIRHECSKNRICVRNVYLS